MKLSRTAVFRSLLGILAFTVGVAWYVRNAPVPFDRAIWVAGETAKFSSDAPRLRMADGLLASGLLEGKSRPEIESMLGPPSKTNKFRNFDLVYWLGAERGFFSIDSEWLVVRFDSNNHVSETSIVHD